MRLLPLTVLLVALGTPLTGFGATISQEECIRQAVSLNSGLQSFAATSAVAAEEINISRSALLPALNLRSFFTLRDKADHLLIDANVFGPGFPSQKTSISTGSTDSYGIQLSLRQPLFTGGALIAAHQKAGHESAAAAHNYSRQTTLLIFQIKKTYNEALIADGRIQAAEKAVLAAKERLQVAMARQDEGYVQRDEVLRLEAHLAMAQAVLLKNRNRSHQVRSRLRQLVGLKPGAEIKVTGRPAILKLDVSLQDLIQGLERRDDINSSREKAAAAEADITIARSGFLPQVFLEGSYLRQKETSITRPAIWSLSVQAEWSLFEWGRTRSSVSRAVAQHSSRNLALEELKGQARLEIEEAWRDMLELQSLVTANEKMVKAEEATLARTIVNWSEGSARVDDVVSSEAVVWEAYDRYCQSAASLNSAFAALEAATSGDVSRWTTQENLYRPNFEDYALLIKRGGATVPDASTSSEKPHNADTITGTETIPKRSDHGAR